MKEFENIGYTKEIKPFRIKIRRTWFSIIKQFFRRKPKHKIYFTVLYNEKGEAIDCWSLPLQENKEA